jgi:hypothetical protein
VSCDRKAEELIQHLGMKMQLIHEVCIRVKGLTNFTVLITNNLNAYTIPYKFQQRFTLLIINDLNLYISGRRNRELLFYFNSAAICPPSEAPDGAGLVSSSGLIFSVMMFSHCANSSLRCFK